LRLTAVSRSRSDEQHSQNRKLGQLYDTVKRQLDETGARVGSLPASSDEILMQQPPNSGSRVSRDESHHGRMLGASLSGRKSATLRQPSSLSPAKLPSRPMSVLNRVDKYGRTSVLHGGTGGHVSRSDPTSTWPHSDGNISPE